MMSLQQQESDNYKKTKVLSEEYLTKKHALFLRIMTVTTTVVTMMTIAAATTTPMTRTISVVDVAYEPLLSAVTDERIFFTNDCKLCEYFKFVK